MEDFWRPVIRDEYSTVRQTAIEANNFELKPALITMVQQHQYTGHLIRATVGAGINNIYILNSFYCRSQATAVCGSRVELRDEFSLYK